MRAISLPFRVDGYGRIVTTTEPSKIWADRTKAAVTTPLGSRIMRPSYGCLTPLQLFSNTEDAAVSVDTDISATFSKWLPDLSYDGVSVIDSPDSGEVLVTVSYSLPSSLQSDNVTVVVEY
jgi:phage baseplate assembly protein W